MKLILMLSVMLFALLGNANAQKAQPQWVFDGNDLKGWTSLNYKSQEVVAGSWNLTTPDNKSVVFISFWGKSGPKINTELTNKVTITLANGTSQTTARFYYRYNKAWIYLPFTIDPNSDFKDYEIDLTKDAYDNKGQVGAKWKFNQDDTGTNKGMEAIRFDIPSLSPPLKGVGIVQESTNKVIKIKSVKFAN